MFKQSHECHRINCRLTNKLIRLQEQGYEFDFFMGNNNKLECLQDSTSFPREALSVRVLDQFYDRLTHSYKYIHTVETTTGVKGVLLCEGIYGCITGPLATTWDLPFYSQTA